MQTSMYVPEPVMSLSIRPKGQESPAFSRAINRFQREDPTFRVHVDSESGEVSQNVHSVLNVPPTRELLTNRPSFPEWENYI